MHRRLPRLTGHIGKYFGYPNCAKFGIPSDKPSSSLLCRHYSAVHERKPEREQPRYVMFLATDAYCSYV